MLFDVDGGGLAGGAHHADAVGALGDVPVNEFAQGGVVDAAVFMQRRCQCNNAASNGFHVVL